MHRIFRFPGLLLTLSLATLCASPALADDELVLSNATLSNHTVTVTVTNTTQEVVLGRVVGVYNTGKGLQEREISIKLAANGATTIQVAFTGKLPLGITEGPDPIPGYIILGTITDDINPQ